MANDDFAEQLIRAYTAGQSVLRQRRVMEWENEDREVTKQMLQHQLKSMKLQERMQARDAAAQSLGILSGAPEEDIPESMLEPITEQEMQAVNMVPSPEFAEPTRRRMSPVEIPGIPELDIPSVQRRPQTMQQQLEQQLVEMRQKAYATPRELSRGEIAVLPMTGEVLGRGDPYTPTPPPPRNPIGVTERDARGVETQTFYAPDTLEGQSFTRHPLPPRPRQPGSGSTAQQLAEDEINELAAMIYEGRRPPTVPGTTAGLRLDARIGKLYPGFNRRTAELDHRAMAAHLRTLNTGDMASTLVAADAAEAAVADLEEILTKWDAGMFAGVQLELAKRGLIGGPEAQQLAIDLESGVATVIQQLAQISSGGSTPTNRAIELAMKRLSAANSTNRIKTELKSLKTNLKYRTNAIRTASAVLTDTAGQPPGAAPGAGAVPKVGDVKTFPNGNRARFDGNGWVLIQP